MSLASATRDLLNPVCYCGDRFCDGCCDDDHGHDISPLKITAAWKINSVPAAPACSTAASPSAPAANHTSASAATLVNTRGLTVMTERNPLAWEYQVWYRSSQPGRDKHIATFARLPDAYRETRRFNRAWLPITPAWLRGRYEVQRWQVHYQRNQDRPYRAERIG